MFQLASVLSWKFLNTLNMCSNFYKIKLLYLCKVSYTLKTSNNNQTSIVKFYISIVDNILTTTIFVYIYINIELITNSYSICKFTFPLFYGKYLLFPEQV